MEGNHEKHAALWGYVERHKPAIESALREFLPLAPVQIETRFNEAVEYALFSGGKRLRPVLTLLGAELFGGVAATMMPAAVAGEFIHTSSLIFDDLPCMDNAAERRGKSSLHEKFGEGLAVLVAIGFLNASYGLVFVNHANLPERAMLAHAELVECIGASGMVGGQSVDLALATGATAGATAESETVRNLKTSALMRLALRVGAILAGASPLDLVKLSRFAELLGDAYQLGDDLIDLDEDVAIFATDRKTFAVAEGRAAAERRLHNAVDDAKRILIENFPASEARSCLVQFADYLTERRA
jgi:geranylgeranyl diphosphate synthase type II